MRLGEGQNLQYGTAPHQEVSAEADEAYRIDTTGMGGLRWPRPWEREEVQHIRIEHSGSRYTATASGCRPPAPTTFTELMESLDIVPDMFQITQGIARPESNHMRLGSGKPQSITGIPSLEPAAEPDSSPMRKAKPVQPVRFYRCI